MSRTTHLIHIRTRLTWMIFIAIFLMTLFGILTPYLMATDHTVLIRIQRHRSTNSRLLLSRKQKVTSALFRTQNTFHSDHVIPLAFDEDPSSCHHDLYHRPILHLGIMSMTTRNKTVRRQDLRSMYRFMLEQPIKLTASQEKALLFHRSNIFNEEIVLNEHGQLVIKEEMKNEDPSHVTAQGKMNQKRQLFVKDFVDVQFIVGKPSTAEEEARIQFENTYFGDLIVLDMKENMNDGKTYEYFKYVAKNMNSPQHKSSCMTSETVQLQKKDLKHLNGYDFVAKGDDDAFIHLPNLVTYLLDIRAQMDRQELSPMVYLGRQWSSVPGSPPAMAGMLYMLSWDLVQWVGSSWIPWMNAKGDEDQQVAKWFHMDGTLNISNVNNDHQWVDHPKSGQPWAAKKYRDDLICIHQSKKDAYLFDAMNHYFPNMY